MELSYRFFFNGNVLIFKQKLEHKYTQHTHNVHYTKKNIKESKPENAFSNHKSHAVYDTGIIKL